MTRVSDGWVDDMLAATRPVPAVAAITTTELQAVLEELKQHRAGYYSRMMTKTQQALVPLFAPVMLPSADLAKCVELLGGRMAELRREVDAERQHAASAHLYARTLKTMRDELGKLLQHVAVELGEPGPDDEAPDSYEEG